MDACKYDRLKKYGAIFERLRYQKTLSTGEKLMLELLRKTSNDYDRCLSLFAFLQSIDEPIDTPSIASVIGVGGETAIQTLRALREGGFAFAVDLSSLANWYSPLKIPTWSMLQWLIDRR